MTEKILLPFIIVLLFCSSCFFRSPHSEISLFQKRKISDSCLHELVRPGSFSDATDCWIEKSFDIKKLMLKHTNSANKKSTFPVGSDADLAIWLEEKSRGTLSEWEYIGSIGTFYIIRTAIDGDTWRHYDLTVVTFLNSGIAVTDQIKGLKGCEILSATVDGDKIIYSQNISGYDLLQIIQEKYSNQWEKLSEQDKARFSITCGYCEYESIIDGNGKIISKQIVFFKPQDILEKNIQMMSLKQLF